MTQEQLAAQVKASIEVIKCVADIIKLAKRVPSGHLFAELATKGMDYNSYTQVISILEKTGLVTAKFHELIWIGPA